MSSSESPFFIIGSQRSGTTMLRLMLNSHSRLCVPFESAFIPEFAKRLYEFGDLAEEANLRRLLEEIGRHKFVERGRLLPDIQAVLDRKPRTYSEVVDAIFGELAAREGKPRWGDKTPSYVTEMDVLHRLFPNAKFIHLVRDGRDVALSIMHTSWGPSNLTRAAEDWRRKLELAHKMAAMLPGATLEIRFEDLVRDPAVILARICKFLGEEYEPQMLQYHESARERMPEVSMKWHQNSVTEVNQDKVFEWKTRMSKADRAVFQDVAGPVLETFGYELDSGASGWLVKLAKLRDLMSG
jgi:hypothetical protein